jgi:hypothetical protein
MSLRPLLCAAVITVASIALIAPSAQAATPGSIQVTGDQLGSALLPPSDFGSGYKAQGKVDSGNVLESPQVVTNVSTMSCNKFVIGPFGADGLGETAVATVSDITQGTGALYEQVVYQFPGTRASESFYKTTYARYGKCGPSTDPAPGVGGKMTTRTRSVSRSRVDGHPAFEVVQSTTFSHDPAGVPPIITDWLFTIDGADIFIQQAIGGSAAPLWSLTERLISRVSALR